MMPLRNRVAPPAGDGNDQVPARSSTQRCSASGEPTARPTATCALPPPAGTANTRSRRAPSVSSYWRAAHSHDSMSTLWATITAHSSAAQNRGSASPLAEATGAGGLCAHADASATIAYSQPDRLAPGVTSATYQTDCDLDYDGRRGATERRTNPRVHDPRRGGICGRDAAADQQRHE